MLGARASLHTVQLAPATLSSRPTPSVRLAPKKVPMFFKGLRNMAAKAAGGEEMKFRVQKSEEEWQKILSQQQYQVLRRAGTEPAGTGEYNHFYPEKGHFACGACEAPMYSASSKFKDSGWIAFEKCYHDGDVCHVGVKPDWGSLEIICNLCGSHLGHVFYGEKHTCTNERH